ITTTTPSRVTITNPGGVAGNTEIDVSDELPTIVPYPGAWLMNDGTDVEWYDPRDTFFFHEEFLGRFFVNSSNHIVNTAFIDGNVSGSTQEIVSGNTSSDVLGELTLGTGSSAVGTSDIY